MLTDQQVENFIYQFRQSIQTLTTQQSSQNTILNQIQVAINTLNATPAAPSTSSSGVVGDTYFSSGGILHKLVTTFQAAVTFASTILVTGVATFTASPVLSAVTASLPLQVNSSKAIVSALINLASMVTGTLPVANGGTNGTTAAAARTSLSAAASGANSDITSLSGLTTPLSVSEGGTGETSAPLAVLNIGGVAQNAFPGGASVVLAKLTTLGTNGSLTVNGNGSVTAYTAPT